ncbi:MAG: T9SS type A sorting domain-containing protein, partial [Candidatus Cloacimonadales bacterium]|nr:T9SS type A sorting domain-containing protein [Candidatus Cloacimonadales bacterium]
TIAAGTSVYSADDFDFSVDADVLGGMEIHLQINITDNLANEWTDFLTIPVEGAILYVSEYAFPSDPNGMLEPGETAELRLTLQNPGTVAANAVYGQLFVDDSWFTLNDDEGYFGNIAAGGQGNNNTNRFEITAATQIIPGSQFNLEVQLYNADGYDDIAYFTITVGEATLTDPLGPDAYGYYCYDDGDIDYYNVPVYDWIEINSIGTNLNLNDPGQTGVIANVPNLPISFKFYGLDYDDLTVCSNGWVAPGILGNTSFMNWHIPGPQGPSPQIAVFWDDLVTSTGDVYYYYDAALNYFVIEWDDMQNQHVPMEETFQVIIYDSNFYPTATGDSEMKFQYKVFNNVDVGSYPSNHGQYCTVGIEDHTGTRGLEYTFNNTYPPQAKVLGNETALLFTGPPIQFEEPYLVLGGVTLNDANGNGQADYAETVDFNIMLNNLGESPATGVSVIISTTDPNVTLTQNTSAYSDVPGSGSSTNITPFSLDVSEDCPNGHMVSFEMDISSNEDSWIVYYAIELNAPMIEFHSVFINDGDNNILDPGETVDIYVSYINNGGSDAYNAVSEISTSDTYITINSSTHNIGNFNAGSIITALYNISVAANTPLGHVSNVSAEINADLNYSEIVDFILRIGFINEGFESGNFESFDWEMSGSADWLISTDAIEGIYSAQSGDIGDSQTTSLYLTMNVLAAGNISFYRKVSSENNYDYLKFYINNQLQGQWCGSVSWGQVTYPVPAGSNVEFKWTYYKDGSVSTGSDCTWIDDILFPPGGAVSDMGFIAGTVSLFGGTGNIEDVTIAAENFITHPDENGHYVLPLQAGMYDVSAELVGYIPDLEENVNVTIGQTTTVNFNLSALQAPENLSATVSSNDVYLEWEMPSDDNGNSSKLLIGTKTPSRTNSEKAEQTDELRNLTGFIVYCNNVLIAEINDPAIFSYWDEALNAGNYNYFVIAVYDESNSGPSNTATAEIVLSAPTNLTAEWQQPDVYLSWDAPTERNLAFYRIYRDDVQIAENLTVNNYTDDNVPAGTYIYKVQAIYDGNWASDFSNEAEITVVHTEEILPQVTALEGNYPNPFNPTTTIRFALSEDSFVSLEIYNIKGEKVRTLMKENLPAKYYNVVWNGRDDAGKQTSSGIYFYKMKAGKFVSTRKMILMK